METEILVQVPADLTKIETMANKKLKIIFITQEDVPSEVRSKLFAIHERFGWLNFLAGERKIDPLDIAGLDKVEKHAEEDKSPGQRLRGVMFIYWSQNKEAQKLPDTFEQYYRMQMEKHTNAYKEKLT